MVRPPARRAPDNDKRCVAKIERFQLNDAPRCENASPPSAAYASAGIGQGSMSMAAPDTLRHTKIPLTHGSGAIPAVGFGTLIPDQVATTQATKTALEVGFRHFDCAERYRNEAAVGDAMQAVFKAGTIRREDVFVTTKLWNTNHRPERVKPAFDVSRQRLRIDYV